MSARAPFEVLGDREPVDETGPSNAERPAPASVSPQGPAADRLELA